MNLIKIQHERRSTTSADVIQSRDFLYFLSEVQKLIKILEYFEWVSRPRTFPLDSAVVHKLKFQVFPALTSLFLSSHHLHSVLLPEYIFHFRISTRGQHKMFPPGSLFGF